MSRAKPRRVPRSALVVALVGGILALQLGQASPKEPPRAADAVVVAADGDLDLRTSLDGLPVLRAIDLHPGDSVSGVVTVHNVGTGSGQLSLNQRALTDIPGPGGGPLSARLQLVVRDVTAPLSPSTVYSGMLASMPELGLGLLGPGQTRIYRFDATFPDGGPSDNVYAGSSASVAYKWTVASPTAPPVDPPGSGGPGPSVPGGTVPGPGFVQPGLRLKVKLAKKQRFKRRTVRVRVRCSQSCRMTPKGEIRVKQVRKPLGKTRSVRKRGKPGRWAAMKLKVSKRTLAKAQKALATGKKVSVRVTVSARTASGRRVVLRKSGQIRP